MLFSVIVPCFNCRAYLRNCLDSILAQNFSDFEVIVIDDGSYDGSEKILDEYNSLYNNFHVYHFENGGVSYARNRGIALANGQYIIFVDSDDCINPNLLYNLSKVIEKHNYPDTIRFQAKLVNDADTKDHERYNYNKDLDIPKSGIDTLKLWSIPGKKYAVYWLFAFKKTVFSNILFVSNLKCYEDIAIIPILIASSDKVVTINYTGYNYTCNNLSSLTHTKSPEAEYSKALDFLSAFQYAISNFIKLEKVSISDIMFFFNDYTRRIKEKYNSLPDDIKLKVEDIYKPYII